MTSWEEYESEFDNLPVDAVSEGWHIEDATTADYAIGRIARAKKVYDNVKQQADAKIEYIKEVLKDHEARMNSQVDFWQSKLYEYWQRIPRDEISSTSTQEKWTSLSGALVMKKAKKDYKRDEEKLLEYLKENMPEYVKTSESTKWGDFKKQLAILGDDIVLKETGEVLHIEGLELEDTEEAFSVSTK